MGAPHPAVVPDPQHAAGGGGILRWLWNSRFGTIVIEVVDGDVFVNGQRVQPHASCPAEDADGRDRRYAVQRRS